MDFTSIGLQLCLALCFIPCVMAIPESASFPNIVFKDFSDFILENFGPNISLSTAVMVLFSMTNNTEVLSLHFKQSKKGKTTAWIRCLARGIKEQLGSVATKTLFFEHELSLFETTDVEYPDIVLLSQKLSKLSQVLMLYPYNHKEKFTGTLKPISHKSTQPALLICPNTSVCLTSGCNYSCLYKSSSSIQDIAYATLIEDTTIHSRVQVLGGKCSTCKTIYYADHECIPESKPEIAKQFYLNSARYLKIGKNLWVDRKFSTGVLNATYDLHASTAGWMNHFNNMYGDESFAISHRQIWSAFLQESIRQVSEASGIDFIINDAASDEDIMHAAFVILGNQGIIEITKNHSCAECSQPYREKSDFIANSNNPSDLLGVDNDNSMPQSTESAMIIDNYQNVTMVVIDGIVVGTKVYLIY